jgi:signal transduction histidine kinase
VRQFAPGREAPVDYADIRRPIQRGRVVAGAIFLAMAGYLSAAGDFDNPVAPIAAGALIVDAALRLRSDRNPLWSFLVDAVAVGLIVAAAGGVMQSLVALLAYLMIGTMLLVRQPGTVWVMMAAAAAFVVPSLGASLITTAEVTVAVAVAVWLQVAVLLTAAGTLLLSGAAIIREARRGHHEALAAEKRASEMKTQFVSMVSHELRTPLTNITGFADTLAQAWRTLDPNEVDEFVQIIRNEADHLGNLVDDILAIPRLETGRLLVDTTDFLLRPLAFRIADLVFPAGGEKEASVQVPGNVVVKADPNRVEQVFRNLLDNARKYGGDRVGIETFPRGETQVIVVADNGHGVPEEARDRIFEQFEQVSRGDTRTDSGVGLGLTVTRRLVEAMDGEVWYEPGFPVGARFCFSLPVGDSATVSGPAPDDDSVAV